MDNDRNAPATKGDLTDAVNGLEERVMEALRVRETRLLKAFYTFAEMNQKRLAEVEKRLNMPPQQ